MAMKIKQKFDPRILEYAKIGLGEGFALEPTQEARGLFEQSYSSSYAVHLPNRIDGVSDTMESEFRQTKPTGFLLMDNMKVEAFEKVAQIAHEYGKRPYIMYRCYFDPRNGAGDGQIGGYISKAIERLGLLLQKRDIRALADLGLLWIKIFNEININGGEGFPGGRGYFDPGLDAWMRVAQAIRREFGASVKIGSHALTPGHYDSYYLGDDENGMYAFHGPEAANRDVLQHVLAKISNPAYAIPAAIQSKIDAARRSRAWNPIYESSDGFFYHAYAQNEQQVTGNLRTWFGDRPLMHDFWLGNYANKPRFIPEWDAGYDQPDKYGEIAVASLDNLSKRVRNNMGTFKWWSARPGEADATWTKHETRDSGGNLRPYMRSIIAYQNGATPPVEPPPDGEPPIDPPVEPNPVPATRQLVRIPDYIQITEANVPAGSEYWHLDYAELRTNEFGNNEAHNIFFDEPHDPSQYAVVEYVENGQKRFEVRLEKQRPDPAADFPIFGADYDASMKGLPSDKIKGMRMGEPVRRGHQSWWLKFSKKIKEVLVTLAQALIQKGDDSQLIRFNPRAGLQNAIRNGRDSNGKILVPNGPEFPLRHENIDYVGQRAESYLTKEEVTGGILPEVYVYYAKTTNFGDVKRVKKG